MASNAQPAALGAEINRITALLRLASHRCGHDVELTFDPIVVALASATSGAVWARDDADPEAGPQFRATAAVVCDGRCVCALTTSGSATPDDDVAEALSQAAFAAGRLVKPLTWRMLQEDARPQEAAA